MEFTARPGKWFWSNGYAWETIYIEKTDAKYIVKLKVIHGSVPLKSFKLNGAGSFQLKEKEKLNEGDLLKIEI
jgi:hypothetical protein